jgi:DNA helicase HerA-like ATPase
LQSGFKDEVDTLVFIDEAQRFLSADSQDNIASDISREARKFGVGLALATQNCSAFPTDIIINAGTKMILGVDEAYQDILAKTLGVEKNTLYPAQKKRLDTDQDKEHLCRKPLRRYPV